jgi:hypothetical protein
MDYHYGEMIDRSFTLLSEKAQEACRRSVQHIKVQQAARGYVGKSSGDAQKLGKAIITSNVQLAEKLISSLDEIISTGGADVPADAAENLADTFSGALVYLGDLPLICVRDYLGDENSMRTAVVARIRSVWNTARIELEQEFAMMVRRRRASRQPRVTDKHDAGSRRSPLNRRVAAVHFEDFSGKEFERLVLAFATREEFEDVQWLGETGSDRGRDICCTSKNGETTVIVCANYRNLSLQKASSDLRKLAKLDPQPRRIRIVAGGTVSDGLRTKIEAEAKKLGFDTAVTWSGAEFEEKIRHQAEALLERFCHGVPFPDTPEELANVAKAHFQSDGYS